MEQVTPFVSHLPSVSCVLINLVGIFMTVLRLGLSRRFTFEHQAVMSKKLSLPKLTLLIPFLHSKLWGVN